MKHQNAFRNINFLQCLIFLSIEIQILYLTSRRWIRVIINCVSDLHLSCRLRLRSFQCSFKIVTDVLEKAWSLFQGIWLSICSVKAICGVVMESILGWNIIDLWDPVTFSFLATRSDWGLWIGFWDYLKLEIKVWIMNEIDSHRSNSYEQEHAQT